MRSLSGEPLDHIYLKGVCTHNLKNLTLHIPRNKFIVVTGLSGSGKSSLAFATLFAEGQRRYLESLNPYIRQFLGKINKPPLEEIKNIPPTIGLAQKSRAYNPRARVSTTADIYPYLRLLYTRLGKTYSPKSGTEVKKHQPQDVLNYIKSLPIKKKIYILAPLYLEEGRKIKELLETELRKGYTRVFFEKKLYFIEDLLTAPPRSLKNYWLVIDRFITSHPTAQINNRIIESAQKAFFEGEGSCIVEIVGEKQQLFTNLFQADGISFEEPTPHFFSFNNSQGACTNCNGFGKCIDIDPKKVIPNPKLTLREGAVLPWKSMYALQAKELLDPLFDNKSNDFILPLDIPYNKLSDNQKELLWHGNHSFPGITGFFDMIKKNSYKIQYRIFLARYRGYTACKSCDSTGLRADTKHVKFQGKSLIELLGMSVDELVLFFKKVSFNDYEQQIAKTPLAEIQRRLRYLQQVGLGYLTLKRETNTLSGGEYQRIKLTKSLGSSLVDSLYILDEPTIGLDIKNTSELIKVLHQLKSLGNTVIVVEHEERIIRSAEEIIEIGPEAGEKGGEKVFQGNLSSLLKHPTSYTAAYLTGKKKLPFPKKYRTSRYQLILKGLRENNLKDITLTIPLNNLVVLTGVSGSGKSTVVEKILYPKLSQLTGDYINCEANFDSITGDTNQIQQVAYFGQNPLGRSSRSNPATYLQVYDQIRKIFSETEKSKKKGFKPGTFSFNTAGGRCEACQGTGEEKIDMQFMADVTLVCDFCQGKKFKEEVLEIKVKDKNINEVLDMTLEEAKNYFVMQPAILQKIKPAIAIGLGYLRLGQPCSTLSGGEAQRLKLSTYLEKKERSKKIFFIFDEPTCGLHMHDVGKLIVAFQALVDQGHSLLVIEHNLEIIRSADFIIELGTGGGKEGGKISFQGSLPTFIKEGTSFLASCMAKPSYPSKSISS